MADQIVGSRHPKREVPRGSVESTIPLPVKADGDLGCDCDRQMLSDRAITADRRFVKRIASKRSRLSPIGAPRGSHRADAASVRIEERRREQWTGSRVKATRISSTLALRRVRLSPLRHLPKRQGANLCTAATRCLSAEPESQLPRLTLMIATSLAGEFALVRQL
jgi:hypothetical protein